VQPEREKIVLTSAKPQARVQPDPVSSPIELPPVDSTQLVANAAPTHKVMPATLAAALPTLPEEGSGGRTVFIITCVVAGIAILLRLAYRSSASGRMRRRLLEIPHSFEQVRDGWRSVLDATKKELAKHAGNYRAEFDTARLRLTFVDDMKRVVPGLRVQPLKDRGINNLLLLQGWTPERLEQLPGIGRTTAVRIAAACQSLTDNVKSRPVPHPSISDSRITCRRLFKLMHRLGRLNACLHGQEQAFDAVLKALKSQCEAAAADLGFARWFFSPFDREALAAALRAGEAVEARVAADTPWGEVLTAGRKRLGQAQRLAGEDVASEVVDQDFAANPGLYRTELERLFGQSEADGSPQPAPVAPPIQDSAAEPVVVRTPRQRPGGFGIRITLGQQGVESIPSGEARTSADCWLPIGAETSIGPYRITCGMVYVGRQLPSLEGNTIEPALIDPNRSIEPAEADCTSRMLEYWSNYSFASAAARASYLQWLTTGRCNPAADIGYVFLYFYGLERRALADAATDPAAKGEIPGIRQEVERLRGIYAQNRSFDRYSATFLEYLEASQAAGEDPTDCVSPPPLVRYQMSFALRRGLGRFAKQRQPLPDRWAFAWYHNDPRTRLPAAATRCPDQFESLFKHEYRRVAGEGLTLPGASTRLKITYRPASSSFGRVLVQTIDLPDVTVLGSRYAKLDGIATSCFEQLAAYSRYLGRNPEGHSDFAALMLLPTVLWPDKVQQALAAHRQSPEDRGVRTLKLRELLAAFGHGAELGRSAYNALCRALEQSQLGLEPDPRFGGSVPELDEPVAVFATQPPDASPEDLSLPALMLQMAAAVASADGQFSDAEAQVLTAELQRDPKLNPAAKRRLLARMEVYRIQAPSLGGVKATIAQLEADERNKLADLLLAVTCKDRDVDPAEVNLLEKIFTLLGQDPATLYPRLHAMSAGQGAVAAKATGPLHLDHEKVRQLRTASDEVARKLAAIFNVDTPVEEPATDLEPAPVNSGVPLDLDPAHGQLLLLLIARAQWTRDEFEEICTDQGLLPDGAIERINEAAFARFDQAFIEGDDPLDLALHLLDETNHDPNHSPPRP